MTARSRYVVWGLKLNQGGEDDAVIAPIRPLAEAARGRLDEKQYGR